MALAPDFEDYLLEEMTHADYDEYWKGLGKNWRKHYAGTADIPMMHVGGWYDSCCGSTIENYVALSGMKRSPMRLVMGPWVHGGNARSGAGDVEFGPAAAIADWSGGATVSGVERPMATAAGWTWRGARGDKGGEDDLAATVRRWAWGDEREGVPPRAGSARGRKGGRAR